MHKRFAAALLGLVVTGTALAASLSDYTDAETVKGLKEALTQSAAAAVSRLGRENGFFGNDKVKIPLPESLQRVSGVMHTLGMGKYADDLELAMNRAAEAAVPEAKSLLVDTVKRMSIQDAKNIVTGGDDAATQYFREKTQSRLHDKFMPIVAKMNKRVALAQKYDQFAGKAAGFGLISKEDAQLNEYVTRKALDGLYLMMAEEEKAIRKDPVGRGGYWLSKIFGAIKQ
jgi:hypothetical protein